MVEMSKEERKNRRMVEQLADNMREMYGRYADALGSRDMRILALEEELARVTGMNEWLTNKLESNERASQQLIQDF